MMKLIDSEKLIASVNAKVDAECGFCPSKGACANAYIKHINEQPVIDAVCVTRCKDCEYSKTYLTSDDYYQCGVFGLPYTVPSLGFCWFGEPKKGDNI